jgi:UrcA family protein
MYMMCLRYNTLTNIDLLTTSVAQSLRGASESRSAQGGRRAVHSVPKSFERETIMTRTNTCIFAVLTLLATSSAIDAAQYSSMAVNSAGYSQVVVRVSDLDLSQPEGAQTMLSRLKVAARKVCNNTYRESDMSTLWASRACKKQAMDQAVASVNSPLVTAMYGRPVQNMSGAPSLIAIN